MMSFSFILSGDKMNYQFTVYEKGIE